MEQLKQTQRIIDSTVFINPTWYTGLASSMCPKWPGHSLRLFAQVSHLLYLSMGPSRGSLKPPLAGLPFNIDQLCSISTTDICLCTQNTDKCFRILAETLRLHPITTLCLSRAQAITKFPFPFLWWLHFLGERNRESEKGTRTSNGELRSRRG